MKAPFTKVRSIFFKQRIFPFSMVTTFIFNATSLLRAVTTRPSSAPLTPGAPSKALTSTPLVRALLPLIFFNSFLFFLHIFFTYFYLSTHIPNLFEDRDSKAKKCPTCCCDITSMALLFVVFRTFRTL